MRFRLAAAPRAAVLVLALVHALCARAELVVGGAGDAHRQSFDALATNGNALWTKDSMLADGSLFTPGDTGRDHGLAVGDVTLTDGMQTPTAMPPSAVTPKAVPVPLPAPMGLMALSMVGMAWVARRRGG